MPVERYLAELTLTFDVSDDLIIHRKVNIGPMPQTQKMPKQRLGFGLMISQETRRKYNELCEQRVLRTQTQAND